MRTSSRLVLFLVLMTSVSALGTPLSAQAGRGAGKGAAIGGLLGLMMGDDLGDAVAGAAAGAAVGAVAGGIDESNRRRDAERAELERLRAQEMQLLEQERARSADDERRRLEEERQKLAEERIRLEQQMERSREAAGSASSEPDDEQAWIAAIGEDNFSALEALVDCQHDRAGLLAEAGGTSDNPNFKLASKWIAALVAIDRRDTERATLLFDELAIIDNDIDNVQQASIEADKIILEVREVRRDEGISCQR